MITKLFECLGPTCNRNDLPILRAKFSQYSPAYVNVAGGTGLEHVKECLESWWKEFQPFADINFVREFKKDFIHRSWELYLGVTLLRRGFGLGTHGEGYPDFDVTHAVTTNRLTWIEAVAVTKGIGVDKVPDKVLGEASDLPQDQVLLRLANALQSKHTQYRSRLEKGLITEDEPYVIAVNSADLGHPDLEMPFILKALFGIGDLTLVLSLSDNSVEDRFWTSRQAVSKQNNQPVGMEFFRDPSHAGVSAVIYCAWDVFNGPYLPAQMGENLTIVHNPLAKNPLPEITFPFGTEYRAAANGVERIRVGSEYRPMHVDLICCP